MTTKPRDGILVLRNSQIYDISETQTFSDKLQNHDKAVKGEELLLLEAKMCGASCIPDLKKAHKAECLRKSGVSIG